jgi:hypothetical protein
LHERQTNTTYPGKSDSNRAQKGRQEFVDSTRPSMLNILEEINMRDVLDYDNISEKCRYRREAHSKAEE